MEYRCRRRQRARRDSGVCVAVAATLLVSLVSISPIPAGAAASECWDGALSDIDGGGPDAIVGLPSYDLPGKPDAGALLVFSNLIEEGNADPSPPASVTLLTANDISGLQAQAGARFGASVVVWRDSPFDDDDHCADLLVGAPGHSVHGVQGAGEVYLIRGTATGPDDVISIFNEADLIDTGGAQAGAGFGAALAAETMETIAIGVPGRDVGAAADAGRVVRLDYTNSPEPEVTIIEEGGPGSDSPEPDDQFGEVLDLMPNAAGPIIVIGVPREDVGAKIDAGAVGLVRRGGKLSLVTQDSPGAGGIAEPGDRYGAALDSYSTPTDHPAGMVAIGVPGEDLPGAADAGMVSYATFDLSRRASNNDSPMTGLARTLAQGSTGVPDTFEAGDGFGATVLVGDFRRGNGLLDLVVGAPLEDLDGIANAGFVSVTPIRPDGSVDRGRQSASWTRSAPSTSGRAQPGDQFGTALSSIELGSPVDDEGLELLAAIMTVPGKDVGTVADAGMAYLSASPAASSVPLAATIGQAGAGLGLTPMKIG
jgi:hypothetical protein